MSVIDFLNGDHGKTRGRVVGLDRKRIAGDGWKEPKVASTIFLPICVGKKGNNDDDLARV